MRINAFKKIVSLLIILSVLLCSALLLVSCAAGGSGGENDGNINEGDGDNYFGAEDDGSEDDYHDKLIAPTYKDYPRDTVEFKNITYSRPNFEAIINTFTEAIAIIEANELSYEQQLEEIKALEDGYERVLSMYSLANIYNSKDTSESYWNDEYAYVSENYPAFAGVVEDLFVAAASSPHAERFEEDYFGDGLIEKYENGGMLTDVLVQLWADEQRLETEYSSLSTSKIRITYKDMNDTVDAILEHYRKAYGETSTEYLAAYNVCMDKYTEKVTVLSKNLFVNLFKVRRLIADELGYESYMQYAYESFGRDYSSAEASAFINDIATNVVPVHAALSRLVFNSYFQTNLPSEVTLDAVINDTYQAIGKLDSELGDIYNYMLLYKLFDIELSRVNRQTGAFTSYINDYDAPFIFMSASGNVSDYSTVIHEFGHFADAYINDNSSTSIDQKEVSSQGLEYLMLLHMNDALHSKDIQYLTYSMLSGALETLIYQGFYAKFEELAYKISYDDISEESLDAAIVAAAQTFGLNTDYVNDISVAFIPHIFLYPFYVQSYCTSLVPALQIYFMEAKTPYSGLEAYKKIIDRTESDYTFVQTLEAAGLTSPFAPGTIRKLADDIYYMVVGSHYYDDADEDKMNGAA